MWHRRLKPVIIIYSDVRRDVAVKLSLPPGEDWTAVYPEPSIRDSLKGRPSVTWHCAVDPVNDGGCLTILGDDVKYSSLFWESKRMTNAGQNSRVNIDLDRSVIGSVATVLESLSNNLRAMSMSDTAATDFMQYWIPALTRIEKAGQHVAIQFVSQEVLNRDTPLVIEPKPDVVTRILWSLKLCRLSKDWRRVPSAMVSQGTAGWIKSMWTRLPSTEASTVSLSGVAQKSYDRSASIGEATAAILFPSTVTCDAIPKDCPHSSPCGKPACNLCTNVYGTADSVLPLCDCSRCSAACASRC